MDESSGITYRIVSSSSLRSLLDAAESPNVETRRQKLDAIADPAARSLVDALRANVNPSPVQSVLRIVCRRYACFAVIEEPYFDLEEWSAYSALYARAFIPHERTCRRVHFFSGNENGAAALTKLLCEGMSQEHVKRWLEEGHNLRYRGFMVLRAGSSFVVGRTAIEFDGRATNLPAEVRQHSLEKTGYPYCTAAIPNAVHIGGVEIGVRSPPFVQQNPAIGMCATASVWIASQVLSHRFGLHKFSYDTITRQAIYPGAHPSASPRSEWKFGKGLTVAEIREAIAWTGASPILFAPGPKEHQSAQARMRFFAYTFVESGLPVVITYRSRHSAHAVTAVGHTVPDGATVTAESEACLVFGKQLAGSLRQHHLLGLASQLYYVHNDAYGPFDRIQFASDAVVEGVRKEAKDTKDKFLSDAPCIISRGSNGKPDQLLSALIVPLPPYVQNSPENVVIDAMQSLDKLFPPAESEKVLWRCFLAFAPDFKQSTILRKYPQKIRQAYVSLHLPLYVWVVEFTVVPQASGLPFAPDRTISGEFLYDSTTAYYEPFCLTQRFGNWFRNCRKTEDDVNEEGRVPQLHCFIPTQTR
jgi:hypothetical protein